MHNIYYLGLSGERSLPFGLLVSSSKYFWNIGFSLYCFKNACNGMFVISEKSHPGIKHSYDIWHAAKNIGKKVAKV